MASFEHLESALTPPFVAPFGLISNPCDEFGNFLSAVMPAIAIGELIIAIAGIKDLQ